MRLLIVTSVHRRRKMFRPGSQKILSGQTTMQQGGVEVNFSF